MRFLVLFTVALLTVIPAGPTVADTDSALQSYIAGMNARNAGDFDGYAQSMEAALAELPGHAILHRHVAQAHALAGRPEAALKALTSLAATGAYFDLHANADFDTLRSSDTFEAVAKKIEMALEPLGEAKVVATLPDPLLVPEGIAYDSQEKAFYLSSLRGRKIVKVDAEGRTTDFMAGHESYFAGLGLTVDHERRWLWAVSASFAGMIGHDESNDSWSSLCAFDLASGELMKEFVVPAGEEVRHNFNDLTLSSSGDIYLTDAMSGAIYHLAKGAEELTLLLPEGSLSGPNGLAVDDARGVLYVAQYNLDIVAIDLASKEILPLSRPDDIAAYGIDGLYLRDDELIAVQNHPSLDRITRFALSDDGKSIESCEVLARRLESFQEPTTGAMVPGGFVFIANSQIATYDALEHPSTGEDLEPVILLKVEL